MRAALQPGDDAAARQRIRESLDESLIVEAAAGTGKTTELVHRVIAVLRQGRTTIERIVAVTFTRKAAGELKLRLRQELDEARNESTDAAERRNLENALEHLEEAHIGTIHGFCAEILRERPIEAKVDPDFEELNELEAPRMFRGVFRLWMERALDRSYPGLQRALGRMAAREWDQRSPIEQLQDAAWKLVEWRDHPGEWRREPFALEAEVDALVEKVRELAAMTLRCQRTTDNLKRALTPVVSLDTWIERAEDAGPRDHQMLEGLLIKLGSDLRRDLKKGSGIFAEGLAREAVVAARDRLLMALDAFKVDADADLAAALKNELAELIPLYQEAKRRAGKVDFLDLLIRVRDLVRDNVQVRNYLQKRFTHLFIDEFQDTDPLQADILILLAANDPAESEWTRVTPEPGKLFLVGDPKQSIYRFRRADVALYQGVAAGLMERGVGLVRLSTSFRAVPEIQQAVNTAFTPEMTGQDGQAEYVPLRHSAEGVDTQPALVVLPVPKPYGRQRVSRASIEACLPDATAAFVEWLIRSSGWMVRDPEDPAGRIPISPRHVCILFRRFLSFGEDMTRAYTRSLEARTIPHLLVGAKSLHRREEVETMRAALAALEWPDDELSVFATLKGSLFAIPDGLLLRFRKQVGSLHPFRRLPEDLAADFQPLAEALAILARLHRRRNRQPIAGTVNALLEETRAHAGFALRPGGHQILANVYRVCELARSFELSGGISFRGFVDELNAQAERADAAEAPVLEEGAEGVRLMTVHSAKGLEFPVVILADMTANLTASQPDRHVAGDVAAMRLLGSTPRDVLDHRDEEDARDRAEGVRIAYVAATRARDLLVIPAVGDEVVDGWLSPLNKAIYPPRERARRSNAAPGCEEFGDDTALARPPDFSRVPDDSVKPGLHAIGDHGVVWWDPHRLRLEVEGKFGLRQEEILAEDTEGAADDSVRRYQEWRERGEELLRRGSEPRYHLFTATTATEMPPSWEPRTELQSIKRAKNRPAGIRFGTLVHTLLRDTPLGASRNTVASLAAVHSRVLGCPPVETRAALTAVTAALRHPLVRQAARAERCHREFPVLLKLDAGWVFEGVLDLAYLDQGKWTVLDFKTDAELSLDKYRIQLEWYVYTIQRITGQPASGCLLSV